MHALFSASAAHRWVRCPGSIPLSEGLDDTAGAAAQEGTFLHEVTNWCLENSAPASAWEGDFLSDEQEDVVQDTVDYFNALPGDLRFYEYPVNYGRDIGQPSGLSFGTLDFAALDGTHLHIGDAKFGRKFVSADENYQMLLYAIGVAGALLALGDEIDQITLHIKQPRVSAEPTPWTCSLQDLLAWAKFFAVAAGEVVEAQNADRGKAWDSQYLDPTPEACIWCRAKAICPKLRAVADDAATKGAAQVKEFESDDLAGALALAPLLKGFIEAVEAEAHARLTDGKPVPGYKLIHGRAGNRKWGVADEDVVKLLKSSGLSYPYTEALMSPPQAETALAKDIDGPRKAAKAQAGELIAGAVKRGASKPSLVATDTPGEPWAAGADLGEFE